MDCVTPVQVQKRAFGLTVALCALFAGCEQQLVEEVVLKPPDPIADRASVPPEANGSTSKAEESAAAVGPHPKQGSVSTVNGYRVLCVAGTPEQMGEQHGRLLKPLVQRVVKAIVKDTKGYTPESYKRLIDGTRVMEEHLPDAFRRELKALAAAAEVNYDELVALQLFGDVSRGSSMYCSTYAVFGKATATGECYAGRNMDYWDYGVMDYGAVIIHFKPDEGIPFFTVSWAGIINGWTLMNAKGIVAANNTGYGARSNSLEGLSTCFMLRKVVQFSETVAAGVQTIKDTPRACGTVTVVAGGSPPNAAEVEYDHEAVVVRWAKDGYVLGTNHFRTLYEDPPLKDDEGWCSRYQRMLTLIRENYGKIDDTMNFTADPGVYMSINLHSVWLAPNSLRFHLAMSKSPAAEGPFEAFKLTPDGIVGE